MVEIWHFTFVSFGKTFCKTLWYFGVYPRDIMIYMFIHNHSKKEPSIVSKAGLAGFSYQAHLCTDMRSSDRTPKLR